MRPYAPDTTVGRRKARDGGNYVSRKGLKKAARRQAREECLAGENLPLIVGTYSADVMNMHEGVKALVQEALSQGEVCVVGGNDRPITAVVKTAKTKAVGQNGLWSFNTRNARTWVREVSKYATFVAY